MSASFPPLCSSIHLSPHSLNDSSELGEIRSCSLAEITGSCVDIGKLPTQFLGSAALTPLLANVFKAEVAKSISIPVIGIGAGGGVDGQVLVIHDMLGMSHEFHPRFLRRYADLYTEMTNAVNGYVSDVKSKDFPNENEQY